MKKYIVTVESIYKNEYRISEDGMEAAVKEAVAESVKNLMEHPIEDLAATNFYIRDESEPKGSERLFGSYNFEEEEDRAYGEMCTECNRNCDDCPFDNLCENDTGLDEDDSLEAIISYLGIIFDRLDNILCLLEKVCEVSPEK